MQIDLLMVVVYFAIVFIIGIFKSASQKKDAATYFLSDRKLRWPSIAMSTIATNIQAGHFIGMGGAAYVYGLAQANFEIGAVFGILLAVFFFVPLYLKLKVFTLTQFFQERFGDFLSLCYAIFSIILFGIIYLGGALFWGSYAINGIFGSQLQILHSDPITRLYLLVVIMGLFSAAYVYLGGLSAVVRTDVIQLFTLLIGSSIILVLSIQKLGGVSELYNTTGHLMHLHLPATHEKIPWTAVFFGMNLMHIQYWGANQVILQRALAARSLKDAQVGLIVGGFLKYAMAILIIVPPIALVGFHPKLQDTDQAYIVLINTLLKPGIRGLVLCGLFASLMSTVDSIINSVCTMFSIDIYKRLINKEATDKQLINIGKVAIIFTTIAGIFFAFLLIRIKYGGLDFPLSHLTNEISYHIKAGFTILILAAVFCTNVPKKIVTYIFLFSAVLSLLFKYVIFPDMNYLNRTGWVIVLLFAFLAIVSYFSPGKRVVWKDLVILDSKVVGYFGLVLGLSLIALHIIFH